MAGWRFCACPAWDESRPHTIQSAEAVQMKKIIIEFSRKPNGERIFEIRAQGERKARKVTRSQYEAFSYAQTLYAAVDVRQPGVVAA